MLVKKEQYKNILRNTNAENCNSFGWTFLEARIVCEDKTMSLKAIVLFCIQQDKIYLYTPENWKRNSLALLFCCNISELQDVRYYKCVGKFKMSFRVKQSELHLRFRKRRVWDEVKRVIEGGIGIETKYKPKG